MVDDSTITDQNVQDQNLHNYYRAPLKTQKDDFFILKNLNLNINFHCRYIHVTSFVLILDFFLKIKF